MTAITQNTFMKEGCRCGFINLPVNQAIYQLKYHNQRYVAKYFAQEICIKYAEEIRRWRPQALVPVPLHEKGAGSVVTTRRSFWQKR